MSSPPFELASDDGLLTATQLAARLVVRGTTGCSITTVANYRRDGMPVAAQGPDGKPRYRLHECQKWVDEWTAPTDHGGHRPGAGRKPAGESLSVPAAVVAEAASSVVELDGNDRVLFDLVSTHPSVQELSRMASLGQISAPVAKVYSELMTAILKRLEVDQLSGELIKVETLRGLITRSLSAARERLDSLPGRASASAARALGLPADKEQELRALLAREVDATMDALQRVGHAI